MSATCGTRSLPSRDSSEHRSDGHPEPRQIASAKNITCHDLSGREDIGVPAQTLDFRPLIHLYAQIGERASRPQRKTVANSVTLEAAIGGKTDGIKRPITFESKMEYAI